MHCCVPPIPARMRMQSGKLCSISFVKIAIYLLLPILLFPKLANGQEFPPPGFADVNIENNESLSFRQKIEECDWSPQGYLFSLIVRSQSNTDVNQLNKLIVPSVSIRPDIKYSLRQKGINPILNLILDSNKLDSVDESETEIELFDLPGTKLPAGRLRFENYRVQRKRISGAITWTCEDLVLWTR